MNEYERKQEERRLRYEARAAKAEAESDRRADTAMSMARQMDGQPILVGHHSEKRHRRYIARMDAHMSKAVEESQKADHYRSKAAGVGKAGISSDDPDAVDKLRGKLEAMERKRDAIKRLNAAWRKAGRPKALLHHRGEETTGMERWQAEEAPKWAKLDALTSPAESAALLRRMEADFMHRPPYTYELSNLGANIKRVRDRVAQLERASEEPDRAPIEGDGWRIVERRDINRVCVEFDAKPEEEVRQRLKACGFRWNRTEGAWTRHLNNAGWCAAQTAMHTL